MAEISYRRHHFPPAIIQYAVWVYLRFTLSYRDVEEPLAERGLDISYETVLCWVLKFGPVIARRLRRCRPRASNRWYLHEMVVRIAGKRMYLWSAVDHEGEVLDMLVQRRRGEITRAATEQCCNQLGQKAGRKRLRADATNLVDKHLWARPAVHVTHIPRPVERVRAPYATNACFGASGGRVIQPSRAMTIIRSASTKRPPIGSGPIGDGTS
jgi:transposase-like protein